MREIIKTHWKRYPQMEPQDMVKLLYQAEFGGGHMIADEQASLKRLLGEAKERNGRQTSLHSPLWEPVGGGLGRLSLDILEDGLSAETMNRMFVVTANEVKGTREGFEEKLKLLKEMTEAGEVGLDPRALSAYLEEYQRAGYPVVSHSRSYHDACDPAYRIIKERYWKAIEVFQAIDKLLAGDRTEPVLVAVDGGSASGKSSLGKMLEEIYGCALFHMDDFFLQPHQRTAKRLEEPGGNVDYERFRLQVFDQIRSGQPFSYQIYDCGRQSLDQVKEAFPARLCVVEGAYSQHPYFGDPYDLRIFLTVDQEKQKERILRRNGRDMLTRFLTEWIPMEQRYFEAFAVQAHSDICIHLD